MSFHLLEHLIPKVVTFGNKLIPPILKFKSSFSLLFHLHGSLTTLNDSLVFASLTVFHSEYLWLYVAIYIL